MNTTGSFEQGSGLEIAIVGMAGRFPGAKNIAEFWKNLQDGRESVTFFSDDDTSSLDKEKDTLNIPHYVSAKGILDDVESFDASFFGFSPRDAELLDPQHRLFLECAWEAFEHAGYNVTTYDRLIGIYAGASENTYARSNLYANEELLQTVDRRQITIANAVDFLASRVSYKLNLRGPSVVIQTACSTSLVAVHMACQALISGECSMALAGGVSVQVPQKRSFVHQDGGIDSLDGHCRAFDAEAKGTVGGNGIGVVVLRRLEDALADGDCIHAVIKGSAINNDGALKVGYSAPSIEGQTEVIRAAQEIAGVDIETISYIEAHGTGTPLGDPIEIAALTQAFRVSTERKNFCAIGSVKTNVGHLDAAAGVTGLIKTTLALKHRLLPPSLHFKTPNPKIDFASSPFYVNATLTPWETGASPLRAGVSSFGVGGTNAHLILEEAPSINSVRFETQDIDNVLILSAKTPAALETLTSHFTTYLEQSNYDLASIAYTLQTGRAVFNCRRMLVCRNAEDAVDALTTLDSPRVFSSVYEGNTRSIVFLFPGQGTQYVNMAREFYAKEEKFRENIDLCAKILLPYLKFDIRTMLYPPLEKEEEAALQLLQTYLTQPALFVIEYALASLWMHWGIQPRAMIGHSIGEYVAACLAGIFSLEDALKLVAWRGQLIQQLPTGAMMTVALPEEEVQQLLGEELSLAAVNAPRLCVVAGPLVAMKNLEQHLSLKGISCRYLHTSHAFHSKMVEPIMETFAAIVKQVALSAPKLPYLSNVSGGWITEHETTDPNYWVEHLRQTVRFAAGMDELFKVPECIFLEVGPGNTLNMLAKQNVHKTTSYTFLSSLPRAQEKQPDRTYLMNTLGRLWLAGAQVQWEALYGGKRPYKVSLPTYPFEHQRYWVEPDRSPGDPQPGRSLSSGKKREIVDWFYCPTWQRSPVPAVAKTAISTQERTCWLLFSDEYGLGTQLAARLGQAGHIVIMVTAGEQFARTGAYSYVIHPQQKDDYAILLNEMRVLHLYPHKIVHLWTIAPATTLLHSMQSEHFERTQDLGFYSLLYLTQALGKQKNVDALHISVISNNMQKVIEHEAVYPERATLLGPCFVIPAEYSHIICKSIDLVLEQESIAERKEHLVDQLLNELEISDSLPIIAYRGEDRWVQTFEAVRLNQIADHPMQLRKEGVYLITGGLGGIGLVLAKYLARHAQAKLILIGRSAFPERDEWEQCLNTYEEDNKTRQKIQKLVELEKMGAEVAYFCADITDQSAMQRVLTTATRRFGSIHGVIHAAAVDGAGSIQLKTRQAIEQVLIPKVKGAQVLVALLNEKPLDFLIFCSSLGALLGGFGRIDYCSANAYLDALAHTTLLPSCKVVLSINWDVWREVGMAVNVEAPLGLEQEREENLQYGILSEEGCEVFMRALQSGYRQIVVSTQDFQRILELRRGSSPVQSHPRRESEKSSLSAYPRPELVRAYIAPSNEVERTIAHLWAKYLGVDKVGLQDNFFDLGGHSLLMVQIHAELQHILKQPLSIADLLMYPTIRSLTDYLSSPLSGQRRLLQTVSGEQKQDRLPQQHSPVTSEIAIVGIAGRFPGARDVEEFWQNLRNGVESISFFSVEELIEAGIDPTLLSNPRYVRARPVMDDVELFDASFFGYSPREAEFMDPQQRLFLECAWQALENAGYDSETCKMSIGVYAGLSSTNPYLQSTLRANNELAASSQFMMGNVNDFLSARVSYKLNLRGPSFTVQTACSTSLVAVHLACESLIHGKCDMALAGGVCVQVPQKSGYLYEDGGYTSPDGHCRAFDAQAQGIVFGSGLGIVVLKRLDEAVADGDTIYAIIKGSAINNDGSYKVGFTAPSVQGQAEVIVKAMEMANVEPEMISYVETHGTGTVLGDPIEVAALTQAFQVATDEKIFCAIGSVKTNIGHLDAASGIAGLIKTVFALRHKEIPPSLHFNHPNPQILFTKTPFYVNNTLTPWEAGAAPRRAGVSSFGIGGTNAHIILEEAPLRVDQAKKKAVSWHILILSAKTSTALEHMTNNLIEHLQLHPDTCISDVAYTLQVGRRAFSHRKMMLCRDLNDALFTLGNAEPSRVLSSVQERLDRPVAFMFPGGGAQYLNMGRDLYQGEPFFREQVDLCMELITPHLTYDLKSMLYPEEIQSQEFAQNFKRPSISLPALFVVEFALAKFWMNQGIFPQAMIGHSLGEYVAACIAGVFSLEDALALVALRGYLFEQIAEGAMLSVQLAEREVHPFIQENLSIAAINSPTHCVVAGPAGSIARLEDVLKERSIECGLLHISTAAHSVMLEPVLEIFRAFVSQLQLHVPHIPFISNVSGTWITPEEATDATYWVKHLRQTVRFGEGIGTLLQEEALVLLEIGPGQTLSTLARQNAQGTAETRIFSSLRHPQEKISDEEFLSNTLARLWLTGVKVDWGKLYSHYQPQRISLPTYPFERHRYWIDTGKVIANAAGERDTLMKNVADWLYLPSWKRSLPFHPLKSQKLTQEATCWLIFVDDCCIGTQLVKRLEQEHQHIVTVRIGKSFEQVSAYDYILNPQNRHDYLSLLRSLLANDHLPQNIIHCWSVYKEIATQRDNNTFRMLQELGYYSLMFLVQALVEVEVLDSYHIEQSLRLQVVANNLHEISYDDTLQPEKTTLLGFCKVLQQEYLCVTCHCIDIALPQKPPQEMASLAERLITEILSDSRDTVIAYRGEQRWIQTYEAALSVHPLKQMQHLKEGGSYLIIGGLGGIGLVLAEYLARTLHAKLVLTSRSRLPTRDEWHAWLLAHAYDDPTSVKIRKIQKIQSFGSDVLCIDVEATDQQRMQQVVEETYKHFGSIHGVIYTAGITSGETFAPIAEMSQELVERQFQAKVYGLYVLERVLQGRDIDFCLLFSSNASILGGLGFVAYTAANLFLDTFVADRNREKTITWISTNWDGWKISQTEDHADPAHTSLAKYALSPADAIEAIEYILSFLLGSQIIVSVGDLQTRIDQWLKREKVKHSEEMSDGKSISYHTRPNLQTMYVEPRNATERAIADIWQVLLGIEALGVYDNFFELGGHSLLAVQLMAHIRETLQTSLALQDLFEAPTIEKLAIAVQSVQNKEHSEQVSAPLPTIVHDVSQQYLPFPLTDIQQAYLLGRSGPYELSNVSSHIYSEFESDHLDLERYTYAWNQLIERHAMLRVVFLPDGRQQIREQVPYYQIKLMDLREKSEQDITEHIHRVRQDMSHQLFPVSQWPLFEIRASLLREKRIRIHFSMDALLIDARSGQILDSELALYYYNAEASLPPLEISFRDYVLKEQMLRTSNLYQHSRDYWFKRLSSLPSAPELPLARDPSTIVHPHFIRRSATVEPEVWQVLKTRAAQSNITPSVVLLAIFSDILRAWSKHPRFTINLTLFNRLPLHPQINDIIGDFTSTTLLEVDNATATTFEERAHHLQRQLWSDLEHRYVSGIQVLRTMAQNQETRAKAKMPVVFTSSLTLEDIQEETPSLTTRANVVYGISQTPQVWLDHQVNESLGALVLIWDAVEELFPEGLLDDMFSSYVDFIRCLATNLAMWQERSPEVVPPGQLQQRALVNATEAPITDELLHTLFSFQALQRPQHVAVVSTQRSLTYEELYHCSNRIGRYLRQQGARPNTLIAVVMEKGWEQVVAVLGILNSGAAYLPIDPSLPQERLEYLLENGDVRFILTQSWVDQRIKFPENIQKLCLDIEKLEKISDAALEPVQNNQDLAYVIYTSGSTGQPKGVMIDHRGAVNTIKDLNQRFHINAEDRILALSSLSFDLSVYDIFGLLAAGGTIVIPDAGARRDPSKWVELLQSERITLWNSVPALLQMLIEYVSNKNQPLDKSSLRLILLSGDWVTLTLPEKIKSLYPRVEVISLGGATEASIWSILYPIETINPGWKSIPYGRPMVNQSFHVLNELLDPCPVWVSGFLYIGGIGLARGYWRDQEKTDASFIIHPQTGERLYRTGDLGRYLPDGCIEFLGREDFQVKVQGHRIELGEIEVALEQHSEVQNAMVEAVGDAQGKKYLTAFVVKKQSYAFPNAKNSDDRALSKEQLNEASDLQQAEGIIQHSLERLKFKLGQPGLRTRDDKKPSLQLLRPKVDETLIRSYIERQSKRTFLQESVPFEHFSALLATLMQIDLKETLLPKYRYPSAGGLYPVQTYLYIKQGRVEGLAEGLYYYHPKEHQLTWLASGTDVGQNVHASDNECIFDESAFSLFLVGQLSAIKPMYGEQAKDFCLLEAGYMSQLLMSMATHYQIGLCPIGGMNFGPIQERLELKESQILLHSLLGGKLDSIQLNKQPQAGEAMTSLLTVEGLRSFLKNKLPEYMVPPNIVLLETLPLTANGKVDRQALLQMTVNTFERGKAHVTPRNDLEAAVTVLWEEELEMTHINIHEDFFDLMGDSLMALRLIRRVSETFEVEIPPLSFFNKPTIADLTEFIAQQREQQNK